MLRVAAIAYFTLTTLVLGNSLAVAIDGKRYAADAAAEAWEDGICVGDKKEMYTVTAYCPCAICCGIWSAGHPSRQGTGYTQRTASGTIPEEGRTAGADWGILPPGTVVEIEGIGERTIEDRGGYAGKAIDLYFDSHEDAVRFGRQELGVAVAKEGPNELAPCEGKVEGIDMESQKICPLLSMKEELDSLAHCEPERCAWWSAANSCCVVQMAAPGKRKRLGGTAAKRKAAVLGVGLAQQQAPGCS